MDEVCRRAWHEIVPRSAAPAPRGGHTLRALPRAQRLLLFGGANREPTCFGDAWLFDPSTARWDIVGAAGAAPTPRSGHGTAVVGHCAYVFGGHNDVGDANNDLHVLDLALGRWRRVAAKGEVPPPRHSHAFCALSTGALCCFGGSVADGPTPANDMYLLDPRAETWIRVAAQTPPPPPREMHSAVCFPPSALHTAADVLVVFGGRAQHSIWGDLAVFDFGARAWSPSVFTSVALCAHGCTVGSAAADPAAGADAMILFGGFDGEGPTQIFLSWNMRSGKLQPVPLAPGSAQLPSPRFALDMCCAADDPAARVYLFGGISLEQDFNDLWVFEPVAAAAAAPSASAAPAV